MAVWGMGRTILALLALSGCNVGGSLVVGDAGSRVAVGVGDPLVDPGNANELFSLASSDSPAIVEVADRAVTLDDGRLARVDRASDPPPLTPPAGSDIAYLFDGDARTLVGVNVEAVGGQGNDLDDTAFGIWLSDVRVIDQAFSSSRTGAFLFARATRSNDMPEFGTATYRGFATATERSADGTTVLLDGPGRLDADFGRRRIEGRFDLESVAGPWGRLDFDETAIDGNDFRGATATTARGHQGTVAGIFTGARAAEIGGVFDLEDSQGNRLLGAFGARHAP